MKELQGDSLPFSSPTFGQRPSNLVQALERASAILDALEQAPQGMSVKELSRKLDLPKGTTHRLLNSLAYLGFVRQDTESRNYFLGFRLVELGHRLLAQLDVRNEARPLLVELAESTGETVHLVVMDRNEVVYVDKVESDHRIETLRMASRIGLRNPAHSSAVGKVLLAHMQESRLHALIQETGLPARTSRTITDPRKLKEQLRLIRLQGYAVDDEENERGIRCVAAPIYDNGGKAVAAISISGPAIRMTLTRIEKDLKCRVMEKAKLISRKLGCRETI
jgi:DNA-binding IclR family transcriptional regulator